MAPNTAITGAMTTAGLNLIQQALSIYDSDLKLVLANERFVGMFGLPIALLQPGADFGETIRYLAQQGEYGPVDDVEAFVRERVDLALAFEPHYIERQRANGRWVSVEGAPLPQGGWVAVYTDITEVKQQEALLRARSEELTEQLIVRAEQLSGANRNLASTVKALEEAKRQLTAAEAQMRLTTEMMPAHIAHVGPDRCYTYSNRRLSSVMPGRPSEIVGMPIAQVLGDSAHSSILPYLDQAFCGTPSVFEFTDRQSSHRIRVAFTPDGQNGVYILSMDVTEETQVRASLQQTRRRELAAQMTSGLAHDFSNLLTIILGMQTQLQKHVHESEQSDLVDATISAARRGGTLLNKLADMTTQRSHRLQATDMAQFLADLATLARPALRDAQQLELTTEFERPVLIDPGMLQDAMVNLILNARDASGPQGRIRVTAKPVRKTWLEIRVADTGHGFDDTALQHALDPFFTTKGAEGGTGLGLPMVYDVTQLAGGTVQIGNTDEGAEVILRLPLRYAARTSKSGLVLLVEDDPDLRQTIRDMLTAIGHTVIEASSEKEAFDLATQVVDIAFVLSDIHLEGGRTGVDLAIALQDQRLPVFLMTSLSHEDPLFQSGTEVAPVLRKPFTTDSLRLFLHPEVSQ